MMQKNENTTATVAPQNALSHNEGKYISKFEYFCVLLSRAGGMFGTTLTGSLAAAFLHELYYGPVGVDIYNEEEYYMFDPEQTNYGTLNEKPCPGYINDGQFDALVENGDVLAMFTGHDHTNAFGVRNQNIDIYTSPMTRYKGLAYTTQYGYRVVEIDENDTSSYTTRVERLFDVFDFDCIKTAKDNGDAYSGRLAFELAVKGAVQKAYMKLYQSLVELFTGRTVTYPDYQA